MLIPTRRWIFSLGSLLFIAWSFVFIHRSSFVAIDGQRYFCLFDDAMISMRYARNLAQGQGLVWNPGERVEGYTNLLMVLLMAGPNLLREKHIAVLIVHLLGIPLLLLIARVAAALADRILPGGPKPDRNLAAALSFLSVLLYYPLAYWSLMGMETGLLTLLLSASALFAIRYASDGGNRDLVGATGALGLAFLTRNDAAIFAPLLGGFLLWTQIRRQTPGGYRRLILASGAFLLCVAAQTVFRRIYYGHWVPNTYVLKLGLVPPGVRFPDGLVFVLPFLISISPLSIAAALETFLDFRPEKLLLLSLGLTACAYQVYAGGDPWPYWRIMVPGIPGLFALSSHATILIARAVQRAYASRRWGDADSSAPAVGLTLILCGAWLVTANARFFPEMSFRARPYQAADNEVNVNTAVALQLFTAPEATLAVMWAGALPYYAGRTGIDCLGKCDRYIASLPPDLTGKAGGKTTVTTPGHNKYDLNYSIVSLRPTYVQRFSWAGQNVSKWANQYYLRVQYEGVQLYLLKKSPHVLWDEIDRAKAIVRKLPKWCS